MRRTNDEICYLSSQRDKEYNYIMFSSQSNLQQKASDNNNNKLDSINISYILNEVFKYLNGL